MEKPLGGTKDRRQSTRQKHNYMHIVRKEHRFSIMIRMNYGVACVASVVTVLSNFFNEESRSYLLFIAM